MHEFVYFENWFDKKYKSKMDGRWSTMKAALNIMLQRGGTNLVETGCARMKDDFGAGYSTVLFCEFVERYGGHLWSIDNDARHLKICDELTTDFAQCRTLVHSDSIAALKEADKMAGFSGKIDLLYLDSYDYPYGTILNAFGGQQDLQAALDIVGSISERQILADFGSAIHPCQEHCLQELSAALPHCHDKTVYLIDDNLPGGGKGRTAKEWLSENGFECILDHQQSLWVRA